MRALEVCIDISASAEMKAQIEALREAFSLDIARPFVLHPAFPFQAPVTSHQDHSPISAAVYPTNGSDLHSTINFTGTPISPPSSTDAESKGHSPDAVLMMTTGNDQLSMPAMADVNVWNPSKLF